MMDTYTQSVSGAVVGPAKSPKRQLRTIAEKRQIVEETMVEGASVARIARAHGVNANQVFYWRMLYRKGRLGAATLLPVRVTSESLSLHASSLPERTCAKSVSSSAGTIHIELRHAQVRIEGSADPAVLRVLLECLQR
ncbi:MAG TPA: transposase [Candidatus Sulfotelmatobacter sp.]